MLNQRKKLLLNLLSQEDSFKTVEYFSDKLGVSVRTIHNYLNDLDVFLNDTNKFIERKSGVGIQLKVSEETKSILNIKDNNILSIFNRRMMIMEELLFKNNTIKTNQLADKFYVSNSSIENDLKYIRKVLTTNNNIKFVGTVNGVSIEGNEIDFQSALLQFIRYISANTTTYLSDSLSEQAEVLKPYFTEEIVEESSDILYSFVKEHVTAISDYYIENVLNILIILTYRSFNNKHITEYTKINVSTERINTNFYRSSAKTILNELGHALNIEFTESEINYITTQLISNKIVDIPEEKDVKRITDDLIGEVSTTLSVNFNGNQKLKKQLENHIESMLYRLKHNYHTHNPFSEQIKIEFNVTFNTIWIVLSKYEKKLNVSFNEDEIAFLTMYFQAAIEEDKESNSILIVCGMGVATSTFIRNKMKNEIPSLYNFETASSIELENLNLLNYDLIVSTIDIEINHPNVCIVSLFLNETDINNIKQSLNIENKVEKFNSIDSDEINVRTFDRDMDKVFAEEFVFANIHLKSKKKLIEETCHYLTEKGIVDKEYTESILEREEAGSTDLPLGVAIPHGNTTYVNQSNITVITTKNKFKWNKYYTDVIIFISIAKVDIESSQVLLTSIYNVISDQDKLQKIRETTNNNELYNIFHGSLQGE